MKHIAVGILAHVDAGKTSMAEAMLYKTGAIRQLGRVDHKDAFLDTQRLERRRGITIFSKQAIFDLGNTRVANMVMLGAYIGVEPLFDVDTLVEALRHKLGPAKEKRIPLNRTAIEKGIETVKR